MRTRFTKTTRYRPSIVLHVRRHGKNNNTELRYGLPFPVGILGHQFWHKTAKILTQVRSVNNFFSVGPTTILVVCMFCFLVFLPLRCATAQQSYCRHVGVCPQNPVFFSETLKRMNAKFWGKLPVHHILKHIFFLIFWFFFHFLHFFFRFVNMGVKVSIDISERRHQICSPKFWGGLLPKLLKDSEILNFGNFFSCSFLPFNMVVNGEL